MQKERPLTHDLIARILQALGAKIERVIINDLKRGTYFGRLILSEENELQQKDHRDRRQAERLDRDGGSTTRCDLLAQTS